MTEAPHGVYCSTAGAVFSERDALADHYNSDLHRYNLKRKVAGLPPVTREWFESKKAQLGLSASQSVAGTKVWICTLTKKKFYSENTYMAYTQSKKYGDLVKKKCGGTAPEPVIKVYTNTNGDESQETRQARIGQNASSGSSGANVKKLNQGRMVYNDDVMEQDSEEEWETASEDEDDEDFTKQDPSMWEAWDLCRSLFDNHVSATMEDNLEYMWKTYGFYLPDSKYLKDPEGLLQYLGAKMQYGHLPLYESGLNPEAKRLKTLHGVQRHMVDRGKTKMLYENNEDEYEDYYDYTLDDEDVDREAFQNAIVALNDVDSAPTWFQAAAGYELLIPNKNGKGVKVLGCREFARYYRQRHVTPKASTRAAALAAGVPSTRSMGAMVAVNDRYRQLTVPVFGDGTVEGLRKAEQKRVTRCKERMERVRLMASMRRNVNDNLPRNVPY